MTDHAQLVRLLAERSARRGNFTLASGRQSTLYIDVRLTTMSPEGQLLIGRVGLQAIREAGWTASAVGGLTLGADPIAYAICHASATSPAPLRSFTVRKEAKAHGTGKQVEGPVSPGDRVVVVEDVITTGQSATRAVESSGPFSITCTSSSGPFCDSAVGSASRSRSPSPVEMTGTPIFTGRPRRSARRPRASPCRIASRPLSRPSARAPRPCPG